MCLFFSRFLLPCQLRVWSFEKLPCCDCNHYTNSQQESPVFNSTSRPWSFSLEFGCVQPTWCKRLLHRVGHIQTLGYLFSKVIFSPTFLCQQRSQLVPYCPSRAKYCPPSLLLKLLNSAVHIISPSLSPTSLNLLSLTQSFETGLQQDDYCL